MTDTAVDHAKITQMLDAGWKVLVYKGPMGSYEVRATHEREGMVPRVMDRLREAWPDDAMPFNEEYHTDAGAVMTDDHTPEQALTRMAYKIFGEVI